MAYTQQKVQTVGGITKTYAINDAGVLGVLGNVSGTKFFPLSEYELQHDIKNLQRDASGRVTGYELSGADAAQYAAAQEAQRIAAAQAEAQRQAQAQQTAQQAQAIQQSQHPVNPTSGLPVGQTFRYAMSHAQQNAFVRENETRKARGQPLISEFAFRQRIGMTTEATSGSYTAPKLKNNSYSAGGTGNSQKVASTANTPNTVTKSNPKVDSQAKGVSSSASVVSVDQVAKNKAASEAAKAEAAKAAEAQAKAAADAKRAAEAEAAAKAKEAARLAAEVRKIADAKAKAEAEKAAKAAAKAAEEAKQRVKIAKESADANANYANVIAEAIHYSSQSGANARRKEQEAVKKMKVLKEKAAIATTKAEKAGVEGHEGQILLKDGTWINPVEKKGNTGKGGIRQISKVRSTEEAAKLYELKKAGKYNPTARKDVTSGKKKTVTHGTVVNEAAKKKHDEAIAAQKAVKTIADRYKVVVDKSGKIIDAVQTNGKFGTGAGSVQIVTKDKDGNIVAASNTASGYRTKLRNAVRNASIPITADTEEKDKKIIVDARNYILTRETGKTRIEQAKKFAAIDAAYKKQASVFEKLGKSASGISISLTEKGKFSITKKGKENKNAKVIYNAGKVIESTPIAISSMVTDADKSYSKAIAPIFSRIDTVNKSIDSILANTDISINEKGQIYIDRKGKGKKGSVTFTAKDAVKSANKNAVISGVTGYGKDVYQYVKEKPFSAGISLASTVAGGAAIGAGSKVAGVALGIGLRGASVAAGTGKAASKLYAASAYSEQLINAGLIGKLTVDISNVAKEKDYKALTGTIVNLAVGGVGFAKGQTAGLRGVDVARTIGKKEVSASSIIAKDILSGKKQIPTTKHGTPVRETIASFRDPKTGEVIGYHTSPVQIFTKVKSKVGRPLDQPGLYVSPLKAGPSMYFSRIQGKDVKSTGVVESLVADISGLTSAAGKVKASDMKATASAIVSKVTGKQRAIPESVINLKSAVKSTPKNIVNSVLGTGTPLPVVNKIHIKKVERAPKKIRYDLIATQKAMDAAKPGKAYITYKFERNIRKGDAETEATIVPNTILKKLKSDRYFVYNGRVVTITEYKALEAVGKIKKGQMGKLELTTKQKNDLLKRYSESKAKVAASKKVKTVKESRAPTQKRGVKPAVRGRSASKSHVSKPKKGLKAPISNYRTGKAYNVGSAIADRKTPYKAPKANYRAPVRASTRKTTLDKSTNTVNRRQPKKPEIRRSGSSRKRENPVSEIVRLDQLVRSSAPVRRQEPTTRTPARAQDRKKPTQKAVSSGRVPNRYPKPNVKNTDYTAKRKAKSVKTTGKQKKDTKHLQRKIRNKLGSLESMFG